MSENKKLEDVVIYRLNKNQKKKLKEDLGTTLRKIEKVNHKQLSDEEQMNVRIAANSNDKDLFNLACLLTFRLLYNKNKRESNRYAHSPNIDSEDYLSETYIIISNHLKEYDGVHSLFTYFNSLITKRFVELTNESSTIPSTRYYELMSINIKKAKRAIGRRTGNYNPSYSDISEYLKIFENKHYNEQSIMKCEELKNPATSFESIDGIMKSYNDDGDPERATLLKEKAEEFEKALNGLDHLSKILIEKEIEYMESYIEMPTAIDLYNMMKEDRSDKVKKIIDKYDLKDFKAFLKVAHRKIRRSYVKRRRIKNPVNNFKLTEAQKEALDKNAEAIEKYFEKINKEK